MIHIICPNPALDRTIFLKNFQVNGVSRANSSSDSLGGKGFNVIRSFLVGPPVDFTIYSFLGGYTGKYLESLIKESTMNHMITQIMETTRICSIIVDENHKHAHLINEQGPLIHEEEKKKFIDDIISNIKAGDTAIFSGSLPEGLSENFYQSIIEQLNKKNVKSVLDSSGKCLTYGVEAEPWLIKINKDEFAELMGTDIEDKNSLKEELTNISSSSNYIITLGSEGCIAKINGKIYEVKLPKVNAKNATASGDIFLGALVKTLINSKNANEALLEASAYSLSNCLYWYPNIASSDIKKYKNKIEVTKQVESPL